MPKGQKTALTSKQEGFCQSVVEGLGISEAYRKHYNTANQKPSTVNRNAKTLIDLSKIAARVAELRERAVNKAIITYEGHLEMLAKIRDGAYKNENYGAAVTAEANRGKAAGFYVDRVHHSGAISRPAEELTDDELASIAATGGSGTAEAPKGKGKTPPVH